MAITKRKSKVAAPVVSKGYERIKSLPDEIRVELHKILLRGQSAMIAAKYLQETMGFFKEVDPPTLERQLQRYRLKELGDQVYIGEAVDLAAVGFNLGTYQGSVDAMKEYAELLEIQKHRIKTTVQGEERFQKGLASKNGNEAVSIAVEIVGHIVALQQDMGLINRIEGNQHNHLHLQLDSKEEEDLLHRIKHIMAPNVQVDFEDGAS